MTVEIISAELKTAEGITFWHCNLEVTNTGTTYALPATAPGTLTEGQLQAHFDADETNLWGIASTKQYPADIYENVASERILKAFALVVLDEINILRNREGLALRTASQIKTAIKNKLRT